MCELTARHGRGTAWARHGMCESALGHLFCSWELDRLCIRLASQSEGVLCIIKVSRSGISKCESRKGRMRWISIATVLIWLSKCEAFAEMQNCWWLFHRQSVYHYSGCFWTAQPWNGIKSCGLNQWFGSPCCICLVPRDNFVTCNWIMRKFGFLIF